MGGAPAVQYHPLVLIEWWRMSGVADTGLTRSLPPRLWILLGSSLTLDQVTIPACARTQLYTHSGTHTYCFFLSRGQSDKSDAYAFWCASGRAAAMIGGWKAIGQPRGMQIWVGEIAAAWHSGEPGVTNRFISSFWWADRSTFNQNGLCR